MSAGRKFPRLFLSGGENLHVGSADIDNEHIHSEASSKFPFFFLPLRIALTPFCERQVGKPRVLAR